MVEQFLFLVLQSHILAGIVTAFIIFPAAIFAKKGSKLHRWAGQSFVLGFIVICAGGFLLEFENLKGSVVHIYGIDWIVSPFAKGTNIDYLAVLNTSMVNIMALFLAVSGWRVWKRAAAARLNQFPRIDALFALLYLVAGIVFVITIWVALEQKNRVEHFSHLKLEFIHFVILAAVAFVSFDAGQDIKIYLLRNAPKQWWTIHARKMISAQMGLAAAFPYRCGDMTGIGGILMVVSMSLVLLIGILVAMRFKKQRDLVIS